MKQKIFGTLKDGSVVNLFVIRNASGEYAQILDYGASLHGLFIKDRNGVLHNTVLRTDTADHLEGMTVEGSVIGRVANRIGNGSFSIDGKTYQLEKNRGTNFIHGGSENYAHQIFEFVQMSTSSITLYHHDLGRCGFECEADIYVTYTLGDDHILTISYKMSADGDTLFCPVNHSYFNIGDLTDARDCILQIHASAIAEKDGDGVPTGRILPVSGTAWDFTKAEKIRKNFNLLPEGSRGFDDYYLLEDSSIKEAAVLHSASTALTMKVFTDMPCLILFTPGFCNRVPHAEDQAYPAYGAVCLEAQFVPNAINCSAFQSPVFHKGEIFYGTVKYGFEAE
jgi:aldose 1-epimerase